MTKENKLALVVGFALILFVGILISDHFSTARTQQSADLLPAQDPLLDEAQDPHLLDFSVASSATSDPLAGGPGPLMNAQRIVDPVQPAAVHSIRMPDLQQPEARVALPQEDAAALPYTFHDVRTGESVTSICRAYYGDTSLVRELAKYNGLDDPDRIAAGVRLRIPTASGLVRGEQAGNRSNAAPAPPNRASASGPTRKGGSYTVKPGDVLGVIAKKTLGTSRRWRELYELNRDVIRDPDHVEAGIVLKLPD